MVTPFFVGKGVPFSDNAERKIHFQIEMDAADLLIGERLVGTMEHREPPGDVCDLLAAICGQVRPDFEMVLVYEGLPPGRNSERTTAGEYAARHGYD